MEQSDDGKLFKKLSEVVATNSETGDHYEITVQRSAPQNYLYCLKMNDKVGRFASVYT